MASLISSLLGMALYLGINEIVNYLKEAQVERKGLTPGKLRNILDKIISTARARGSVALEKVTKMLSESSNAIYGTNSSALTPYIRKAYAQASALYDKVSDITSRANAYDQSANLLGESYESLSSYAKQQKTGKYLKGQAKAAANNAKNYYKWAADMKDTKNPNLPGPQEEQFKEEDVYKDQVIIPLKDRIQMAFEKSKQEKEGE